MSIIKTHVDHLFSEAERLHPRGLENPVTGEYWLANVVPAGPEKRDACRALLAREWLTFYGPPDAPLLPVSDVEIELAMNYGDFSYVVARFAISLRANDWDFNKHPNFEDFARGLLHTSSPFGKNTPLRRRYPPYPLHGLGTDLVWRLDH